MTSCFTFGVPRQDKAKRCVMRKFYPCIVIYCLLSASSFVRADDTKTYCYATPDSVSPDLSQIMSVNTPETSLLIFQSMLPQASRSHDKSAFVDLLGVIAHNYFLIKDPEKAKFYLRQAELFLSDASDQAKQNLSDVRRMWHAQR
ncbi:hypothetical protein [Photobacterium sp. 53610]|uniref:hypothetical protein n=1 Tax=Photobacterium sp. 53610 TaxID=3102789 RepID=UPI002ED8B007